MKLYMIVTADEYELPLMVADKAKDLAKYKGISPSTVSTHIKRKYSGKISGIKYIKIEIDNEEKNTSENIK